MPFGLSILSRSLRNKTQKEPLTPSSYLLRDSERKTCSSKKKKKKNLSCFGRVRWMGGPQTGPAYQAPPFLTSRCSLGASRESARQVCVRSSSATCRSPILTSEIQLLCPPRFSFVRNDASTPHIAHCLEVLRLMRIPAFVYQNRDVSPINLPLLTYQPGWKN